MSNEGEGVGAHDAKLLLPDVVKQICKEGQGLRWDTHANRYEVTDPELFVSRFKALRRSRRASLDGGQDRPFAAMHRHFKLVSGRGWTSQGATFSPITLSKAVDEAVVHEAVEHTGKRARSVAHKPSNSWFYNDVKYCAQCGRGTIVVEQEACKDCGGPEWNFAGVSAVSTNGIQRGALEEMRQINGSMGFEAHGDHILTGDFSEDDDCGLSAAQAALRCMVDEARTEEGELGCRWELRSLHLGEGVCAGRAYGDVLRAFLQWSQTEEDRLDARFNISKAMRRLSSFASFSEKYFEEVFNTPLTLNDPDYPLVSLVSPVLAPWHTPGGHVISVVGGTALETGGASFSSAVRQIFSKGSRHGELLLLRYYFTIVTALMFDDNATKHGCVNIMLLDKFAFSDQGLLSEQSDVYELWYSAAPIKSYAFIVVGIPWWSRWLVSIARFGLCKEMQQRMMVTDYAGLHAFIGGERYMPPPPSQQRGGISIADYCATILHRCTDTHATPPNAPSPSAASTRACPRRRPQRTRA